MITVRNRQNLELFDRWSFLGTKRREILRKSWSSVFRDYLLTHLPVEKLAEQFCRDRGRPSKDLHVAIGVLLLQQLHDLTDQETVEALAFRIDWHFALDLHSESDAYLSERTLRNYRRRIIDQDLDSTLFRSLTDHLVQGFEVDTCKQRLDSTALQSAMRSLTRLGTVVETISKFLRELKRCYPSDYLESTQELWHRYVERSGDGHFGNTRPSESKRRLPEAGRDLSNLIETFQGTGAETLESFQLLGRVFEEQFEIEFQVEPRIRVKLPREIPCTNVNNPADPDSSYNARRGQGYMVQVMETYRDGQEEGDVPIAKPPDLITHIAVHDMTVYDGHRLVPALEDVEARGIKPESVVADTHYGSRENLKKATSRKVKLISPTITAKGSKKGMLTLEQFDLDAEGSILQCPAGHAPLEFRSAPQRFEVRFDEATCQTCNLRAKCPAQTTRHNGKNRYQYSRERVQQRLRRLHEKTDDFKKDYRWRAGVEGTVSRLKYQMKLKHLRIRGLEKVRYVAFLRALGLNIRRCATANASKAVF